MNSITLNGQLRTGTGKKATRQIRSQEQVPAVIYGGSQEINCTLNPKELKKLIYSAEFMKANIVIGADSYDCILKDLQFHKVTDNLLHIDFLQLVDDKKVIATIPLKYVGTPVGVKAGGKLVLKMKAVKVKTLPKYLTDSIEVDISNLNLNENMRVEDIKVTNMEILNSPRIPIASVVMTRALKQEEAAASSDAKKAKK